MKPELIRQFDSEWLVALVRRDSLDRILDVVRLDFRLPANFDFSTKDNRGHVCIARHVAAYLLRELSGWPFPRIGISFKRDHSTIVHSYEVVARRMRQNPQFARLVERLMAECK